MAQFVDFCNDLVRLFSPVHAEIYDYTSSIPCTNTNKDVAYPPLLRLPHPGSSPITPVSGTQAPAF